MVRIKIEAACKNAAMTHLALTSTRTIFLPLAMAGLLLMAGCAGPGTGQRPSGPTVPPPTIALDPNHRSDVVLTALGLLQTHYRYGGSAPATGFDCSGLVAYVFRNAADQPLPHNTAAIAGMSRPIAKNRLEAGDFVFFNTLNRPFSHMGIYIGDGRFVNAPSTGGQVRIDSLHNPYFAKRFESARTIFRS